MTRDEYEEILGDPASFIITPAIISMVRKWAIAAGHNPVKVAVMKTVELANLYHAKDDPHKPVEPDDDLLRITSDILVKLLSTVTVPGFNVSQMRVIATQQLRDEIADGTTLHQAVKTLVEQLAPRRLEIASPHGFTILDGPLHYITEDVIKTAALAHPIMLVGPAGCGKTTIGQHVAQALQLPFYITSTINDTHELTGFIDGHGHYHRTPFRNAFEYGGVWVADEIDAWDASALLAANSALANGFAVFPDNPTPIQRSHSFRILATANTYGNGADRVYIGRNELDAASLDRFATINVDYDLNLEQQFANGQQRWLEHVWNVRKIVTEKRIRHVVSSRAILMGSTALNAGIEWDKVEERYLLKGMNESDRKKVQK